MISFKDEIIEEFKANRSENVAAIMSMYTAACGDKKAFLKAAMSWMISEDGNESFCRNDRFAAFCEEAGTEICFNLDAAEKAACDRESIEDERGDNASISWKSKHGGKSAVRHF